MNDSEEYIASKPESYLTYVYDTVKQSSIPLVVLFVEDICDSPHRHNPVERSVINKIQSYDNKSKPIKFIRICVHKERMPFPEPKTNTLYFFAPGQPQHLFTRPAMWCIEKSFERDIEGIYKMMENPDLPLHEAVMTPQDLEDLKRSEAILEEEEEKSKEYPSLFSMVRSVAKDAYESAKRTGYRLPVIAPDEVAVKRYSICQDCEHFDEETTRCDECGCYMKLKVNVAASKCPIDKWDKYDG